MMSISMSISLIVFMYYFIAGFLSKNFLISFVQMDGNCGNVAEQKEVERNADVTVSDAGADDVRRDHLAKLPSCPASYGESLPECEERVR